MPGYVTVQAACFGCRQLFSFHPHKVPAVRVAGSRKPICENCVRIANPKRIANGLEPIAILPGAYDGCPEEKF